MQISTKLLINNSQNSPQKTKIDCGDSSHVINFKGKIDGIILKSTYNTIEDLYKNYKKSLDLTTVHDLKTCLANVSKETNKSDKDILKAMQLLTQFGDVRSLDIIGQKLNHYGVERIGNSFGCLSVLFHLDNISRSSLSKIANDTGLQDSLEYLLKKKLLTRRRKQRGSNISVFLDDKKITELESLKKQDPKSYKVLLSKPEIKFFHISGWDSGITFFNMDKNLEKETIKLIKNADKNGRTLEEELDYKNTERIKNLGINPIIIKNEGEANISNIHKQITPDIMAKNEVLNLIDANVNTRFPEETSTEKLLEYKGIIAEQLKSTLQVYSSKSLSKKLRQLHIKLVNYAKELGKNENDIIYAIAKSDYTQTKPKSTNYITYSYQKINNIKDENIIDLMSVYKNSPIFDDKIVVILDDCTISGDSLVDIISGKCPKEKCKKAKKVIFACVTGTEKAEKKIKSKFNHKNQELLILDKVKTLNLEGEDKYLVPILGYTRCDDKAASCLVFPYMAPDNNYEFASNVAFLHNVNYRNSKLSGDTKYIRVNGVKNVTPFSIKVASEYIRQIGKEPKISKTEINYTCKPKKRVEPNLLDKIKSVIFG